MTSYAKRFLQEQPDNMQRLFGEDVDGRISPNSKPDEVVSLYLDCLKRHTRYKYFLKFALVTKEGNIHHLIFATRHPKGLEVMKRAMWKADKTGQFQFRVNI